jgi:drug/metabolite transporter (DMT)-like permease
MMASLVDSIFKNKNSLQLGYALILISAILVAVVHVVAKPLLENQTGFELHPVTLVACVYIINAAFFTPFTKKSLPIASLGQKNLVLLAIIGVAEVIALAAYFFGLRETTAANASIFSNGEIIFSLLIAMSIFKEKLQRKELGPFAMIILGMLVLPVMYDFYLHGWTISDLVLGDAMLVASGAFYALNVTLCKYVNGRVDSKRFMQIISAVSAIVAFTTLIIFKIPLAIDLASLGPISFFAIGGTGLSAMLFVISIRLIGGVRTILIFSTNSVLGVIFAAVMLGESITVVNMFSVALTFGGVFLLRNRLGKEKGEPKSQKQQMILPAQDTLPTRQMLN